MFNRVIRKTVEVNLKTLLVGLTIIGLLYAGLQTAVGWVLYFGEAKENIGMVPEMKQSLDTLGARLSVFMEQRSTLVNQNETAHTELRKTDTAIQKRVTNLEEWRYANYR